MPSSNAHQPDSFSLAIRLRREQAEAKAMQKARQAERDRANRRIAQANLAMNRRDRQMRLAEARS
jgi:hypothetical protein